jgi:hypothetical protein
MELTQISTGICTIVLPAQRFLFCEETRQA